MKMTAWLITFIFTGLTSSLCLAEGFSRGSQFTSVEIEGVLRVQCSDYSDGGGPNSAIYNCYESLLDPYETDYFVTDESFDANKVTLISENNGRRVEKTEKYLPEKKRSKGTFNLWLSSVFQKPLLAEGENHITYMMKKGDAVVKTGSFLVNVGTAPTRRCPHRSIFSFDARDCRSSSYICSRYFREENFCNSN